MAFYHFSKLQIEYPIVRVSAQQPSFTQGHSIVSSPSKLVSDSEASLFPSESTLKKTFSFCISNPDFDGEDEVIDASAKVRGGVCLCMRAWAWR
ncbi:hypothetical protein ES288_A07G110400v1 [Gossypium darwinii]|uniref:Uncharacterized protein n=1 Tax=Gossypium darwinii TaxID=34276 RepID=A0A5D2FVU9_GOSDA|nr:hypothetical protein ES288_A07G110400v1 [Gossypium darwinii]